jgi:hypothetical protein
MAGCIQIIIFIGLMRVKICGNCPNNFFSIVIVIVEIIVNVTYLTTLSVVQTTERAADG